MLVVGPQARLGKAVLLSIALRTRQQQDRPLLKSGLGSLNSVETKVMSC